MSKVLGLLDVLESIILDSKRVPLTQKAMVDEEKVIGILDKIRTVIQSEEDVIQKKIDVDTQRVSHISNSNAGTYEEEVQKLEKLKRGAEEYAHFVLSNLQLTITKMQNNLVKLEKNIESGQKILDTSDEKSIFPDQGKKEETPL